METRVGETRDGKTKEVGETTESRVPSCPRHSWLDYDGAQIAPIICGDQLHLLSALTAHLPSSSSAREAIKARAARYGVSVSPTVEQTTRTK